MYSSHAALTVLGQGRLMLLSYPYLLGQLPIINQVKIKWHQCCWWMLAVLNSPLVLPVSNSSLVQLPAYNISSRAKSYIPDSLWFWGNLDSARSTSHCSTIQLLDSADSTCLRRHSSANTRRYYNRSKFLVLSQFLYCAWARTHQ